MSLAACALCGVLSACAGGRSVSVRVEAIDSGGGMSPVRGAFVQVVPVAMAPVPLPVNLETLGEAGAVGVSGFTDERGVFRFEMAGERAHEVAVSSPISVTEEAKRYTWRGHLDASGRLQPMDTVPMIQVTTTEARR